MKSSKTFATAVLVIFASLTLFPQSVFADKVKQPLQVTIQNTSVPVTIGNTSLPVTVGNSSLPVTIGNTSVPVTIGNTSVSTENAPQQPFQWSGDLDYDRGNAQGGFTVPAEKRLVIEYVSGSGTLRSTDGINGILHELSVTTNAAGVSAKHYLTTSTQGWDAKNYLRYLSVSQNMRAYADPDTKVNVSIRADWSGSMSITISGYLIDAR